VEVSASFLGSAFFFCWSPFLTIQFFSGWRMRRDSADEDGRDRGDKSPCVTKIDDLFMTRPSLEPGKERAQARRSEAWLAGIIIWMH
jgi:hypothetical protein